MIACGVRYSTSLLCLLRKIRIWKMDTPRACAAHPLGPILRMWISGGPTQAVRAALQYSSVRGNAMIFLHL